MLRRCSLISVKWAGRFFERTLSMGRQQIERLDLADRSRVTYLRMDHEAEACGEAGFYFEFSKRCCRMAGTIVLIVSCILFPFLGIFPTALFLTPSGLMLVSSLG